MKFSEALAYIRFKTETDATTFPVSSINVLANVHKNDLAKEIAKINEDYFGIPQTRDLVAGQREYSFPAEVLNNIKMVEVKLDGTNWRRAEEFDLNNYLVNNRFQTSDPLDIAKNTGSFSRATTDETSIQANFSDESPKFEVFRKALWIFSGSAIQDVSAGLKLWAIMYPKDFAEADWSGAAQIESNPDSSSSGFPTQFQKLMLERVIWDYKYRDKSVPTQEYNKHEAELKKALNAMRGTNLDREILARKPYNDGSSY